MDLKAELGKAKEAAREAEEATEALEQKFYNLGVQETEARLTEELAEVCKEYCHEEWRKAENIYYPQDLHEAPTTLLGLRADATPTTTAYEYLSTTHASLSPPKISEGSGKADDQWQGVEVAKGKEASQGSSRPKDKGKGKEAKPLPEIKGPETAPKAKDAASKTKEAAPQAKDAAPKAKEATPKATNHLVSQLGSKEDSSLAKA